MLNVDSTYNEMYKKQYKEVCLSCGVITAPAITIDICPQEEILIIPMIRLCSTCAERLLKQLEVQINIMGKRRK